LVFYATKIHNNREKRKEDNKKNEKGCEVLNK
jgi:hypothetical protein